MSHHFLLSLLAAILLVSAAALDTSCTANTFQIVGSGQVSFNPDIVRLTISATGNGTSASAALSNLNAQINIILSKFNSFSIPEANYSTSGININQVYDYSTTPYTISGSQATQSLSLTLGLTINLTAFIQSLSNVNITVSNMAYDLYDHTYAIKKARAAAFTDAKNKLNQYLLLTASTSSSLKKISDLNSDVYTPYQTNANLYALASKLQTPPGKVQISASVSTTWKVNS